MNKALSPKVARLMTMMKRRYWEDGHRQQMRHRRLKHSYITHNL